MYNDIVKNALVLSISQLCPVNCDFCCVYPPSTDRLSVDECIKWICLAKKNNLFQLVGFTGGEPFYFYDDIVNIMNRVFSLQLKYSIATSAYWVDSYKNTFTRIKDLKDLGLDRINISCDPGHQCKVPIKNVQMLANISDVLGLKVHIVGTFEDVSMNLEMYLQKNNIEFDRTINLITKYIAPFGKAKNIEASMGKYGFNLNFNEMFCHSEYGFDILVWPNGDVYPCCSTANIDSSLIMGNIRKDTFDEVVRKTLGNVFFRVIKRNGFQELIDICEKYNCSITPFLPKKSDISGPCGLCLKLMNNSASRELIEKAISYYEIDLLYEIVDTYIDENEWL